MILIREDQSGRPFHTAQQVAERWQVSVKKILRMIHKSELIAYRFGSQWRIGDADLIAYERQHWLG